MFCKMAMKPTQVNTTKKELCESVANRISRANLEMRFHEERLKAKLAVKHIKKIQDLPSYCQVINMTHAELNQVLNDCPESPFFASQRLRSSEAEARDLVLRFVERAKFGDLLPHIEASPEEEQSYVYRCLADQSI